MTKVNQKIANCKRFCLRKALVFVSKFLHQQKMVYASKQEKIIMRYIHQTIS